MSDPAWRHIALNSLPSSGTNDKSVTINGNSPAITPMPELIWDGKYLDGKKAGPVRIALPFQTVETVNESAQDRQRSLELFSAGRESEWRNRLIWGDKKYVLPS